MSQLLERDRERAALRHALDGARGGAGSLVIIEGAAGVGKSALLQAAASEARGSDMAVLTAIGGELDRDFPFGMVRQLLEPEVLRADEERRAALFSGAAAAASPILGLASGSDLAVPDAGFAVLHGLYWLVAALAEERPLMLSLDDAHWADAPSLRFVEFLARRVAELDVVIVLGTRPEEPGAEHVLLPAVAGTGAAGVIRAALLSEEGATALVAAETDSFDAGGVAAAHEATGGNPLLLRELARAVAGGGTSLTEETVREAVPSSVTRSVQRRLDRLEPLARSVARALAVLGDRRDHQLLAAVTESSPAQIADSLDALRGPQLVLGDPPAYTHPLLREAVAATVSRADGEALHAAAANVLHDQPGSEEQAIVHLLAAPGTRSPWQSAALRASAARALAEGAPDAAVLRLRRALETDPADAALLLELGMAEASAGDPATATLHLKRAELEGGPEVAARAAEAQINVATLLAGPDIGAMVDRLESALLRLGPDADPKLVDQLQATLLNTLGRDADGAQRRRDIIARAGLEAGEAILSLAAIEALNSFDASAGEIAELIDRALATQPARATRTMPGPAPTAAFACTGIDLPDPGDGALLEAEQGARRAGSRFHRTFIACARAEWLLQFGTLPATESVGVEAAEFMGSVGMAVLHVTSTSTVALARVWMNKLEEANAWLAAVDPGDEGWHPALFFHARAELRLAQGRPEAAVTDLERCRAIWAAYGWRQFARDRPIALHALALSEAGRTDEALEVATEELDFARRTRRVSAEVAALTVLGRALGGDDGLATLAEAVEATPRSRVPRVRAAARIEYGAALRRAGRRAEAREHLRTGGEEAASVGAAILEKRALEELTIAGARHRDPFSSGLDSLTPSERRVAEHAARGLTNREIAETLFVTQKTVEVHLGKTYAKLEIRSRNQLADALGGTATP